MKKVLFFSMMCLLALTMSAQDYVDLGLPSGTKWKKANEEGLYSYDQAARKFSDNMPTKKQFEELKSKCSWSWTGDGYSVTGPNGNSIFLPAAGYRYCNGNMGSVGSNGDYWSSSPNGSDNTWNLFFHSGGVGINYSFRCYGMSVRLVQDK